jgi:hypothetical protein
MRNNIPKMIHAKEKNPSRKKTINIKDKTDKRNN